MAGDRKAQHRIDPLGEQFARHVLRSELQRTIALIGVLFAAAVALIIRPALGPLLIAQFVPALVMVGSVIFYECMAAALIARSIKTDTQPGPWFWILNILVECTLPTCGLLISWRAEFVNPEHAVGAPVAFLYCVFTLLSILRLRPWLTLIGGLTCAVQYLTVGLWIESQVQTGLPRAMLLAYPFVVGLCGGAAFFVSSRLRASVRSGLEEATERQRSEG